jgi:DNA polymerase-2
VRGIEARRGDTPPFLSRLQHDMLAILAQATTAADLPAHLPRVAALLDQRLGQMRRGRVPLEDLLVRQRLSRALEEYKVLSPAAEAAAQLQAAGKPVPVGRSVRFLYLRGKPRLAAWDLPRRPPRADALDGPRYFTLFLRAAAAVLEPLGVSPARLEHWLLAKAGYGAPPGYLPDGAGRRLPLWY